VLGHGAAKPETGDPDGRKRWILVQNDANFEKGLTELREAHPSGLSWFGDHLPNQRNNWENDFTDFRNHFLEHRQEEP
jgi:hypothetical protein